MRRSVFETAERVRLRADVTPEECQDVLDAAAAFTRNLVHQLFWCQVAVAALCKLVFQRTAIEHFDGVGV